MWHRIVFAGVLVSSLTACSGMQNPLDGMLGLDDEEQVDVVSDVEVVEVDTVDEYSAVEAESMDTFEEDPYASESEYGYEESSAGMGLDAPAQRLFYFGFDSSAVSSGDLEAIRGHAQYLTNRVNAVAPPRQVRLEGHADERGSREYNLALGERRARAVADLLEAEGAGSSQIEVVSYGEENPVEEGHDEAAWAQNRRVELIH